MATVASHYGVSAVGINLGRSPDVLVCVPGHVKPHGVRKTAASDVVAFVRKCLFVTDVMED